MSDQKITAIFSFNGHNIEIQCLLDETMELLFQKFCVKTKTDKKDVCFLY